MIGLSKNMVPAWYHKIWWSSVSPPLYWLIYAYISMNIEDPQSFWWDDNEKPFIHHFFHGGGFLK